MGASQPEEYGNYYAWGETTTKNEYSFWTYQFSSSEGYLKYVNIGDDISGTSYDSATVTWGTPWRMPSKEQIEELLNNTSSLWVTLNGVRGALFTNGVDVTLFLPAAGYITSDLWDCGREGFYLGATHGYNKLNHDFVYGIGFSLDRNADIIQYEGLCTGYPVRPVR